MRYADAQNDKTRGSKKAESLAARRMTNAESRTAPAVCWYCVPSNKKKISCGWRERAQTAIKMLKSYGCSHQNGQRLAASPQLGVVRPVAQSRGPRTETLR